MCTYECVQKFPLQMTHLLHTATYTLPTSSTLPPPPHYHLLHTTTSYPPPTSSTLPPPTHCHLLHTATSYTLPPPTHCHLLHTATFYTLPPPTHHLPPLLPDAPLADPLLQTGSSGSALWKLRAWWEWSPEASDCSVVWPLSQSSPSHRDAVGVCDVCVVCSIQCLCD